MATPFSVSRRTDTPSALGVALHDGTHRLLKRGAAPRRIGRTKGGLNSKLQAARDGDGKPLTLLLIEGQISDYFGTATVLPDLPEADMLIAEKGYDSDWFRKALTDLRIEPCIPGRSNRKAQISYDADPYKRRNRSTFSG